MPNERARQQAAKAEAEKLGKELDAKKEGVLRRTSTIRPRVEQDEPSELQKYMAARRARIEGKGEAGGEEPSVDGGQAAVDQAERDKAEMAYKEAQAEAEAQAAQVAAPKGAPYEDFIKREDPPKWEAPPDFTPDEPTPTNPAPNKPSVG